MHCTSCGAKLEDGAKFCTNCGAPVANSETNQPTIPFDDTVSSQETTPLGSTDNQPTAPIADVSCQQTAPVADVASQPDTSIASNADQPTTPIASNAEQPTTSLQSQSNQVSQNETIPLQQQTIPVQQSAPAQQSAPVQQSAPTQPQQPAQQPTPKQPLSRNAKIGIGVGVGVVVLAIIVGIVFFAMNGANQQQSEEQTTQETQTTVIDNTDSTEEQTSEPETTSDSSSTADIPQRGDPPQPQSDSYTDSGISGYTLYTNARFGYSVAYPETFTIQEVNNGSGINLENDTANGTIMINLWGSNNIDGSTAKSALDKMENEIGIEGYSASGDDWFVYSYEIDGTVVYVKEYVGSGSIAAMSITYPKSASVMGDEMCEIMEPTLEPGDITQAH